MKILFLGSSKFSVTVLKKILDAGVNVSCVITQPDCKSGRGYKLTPTVVKKFAIENDLNVRCYDKIKNHIEEIKMIDYDVAVVASFSQILPQEFLDIKFSINVHPSLLPKYRGPSPIQTAILNGDTKSGVTIMKLVRELDAGDIILQKETLIGEEYYLELEEKLANIGGELLLQVFDQIETHSLKFTKQDNDKASYTKKFSSLDGDIDFSFSGNEIINKIRALSETVGCFIKIGNLKLKILRAQYVKDIEYKAKTILNNKKRFLIGCKDGAIEIISCISPSGKTMNGKDFLNGHCEILNKEVSC